ncbi:hypothetical protein C8R42DRAFT_647377 [Lentinula raphanica]|nr:hypothetical protein C8R42DRAFT_647377 [Lentinula raphanica]
MRVLVHFSTSLPPSSALSSSSSTHIDMLNETKTNEGNPVRPRCTGERETVAQEVRGDKAIGVNFPGLRIPKSHKSYRHEERNESDSFRDSGSSRLTIAIHEREIFSTLPILIRRISSCRTTFRYPPEFGISVFAFLIFDLDHSNLDFILSSPGHIDDMRSGDGDKRLRRQNEGTERKLTLLASRSREQKLRVEIREEHEINKIGTRDGVIGRRWTGKNGGSEVVTGLFSSSTESLRATLYA